MAVWVVYALLAAVFAACVTLFAKIGLSGVDAVVATTIRAGVMTLLLVGVCLAAGKRFDASLDRSAILWISASGVAGALSWLFYFLALRDGSAAAVAALDRTSIFSFCSAPQRSSPSASPFAPRRAPRSLFWARCY
jgi:transporter family protein